jgi:DNA polymerase-3 subunit epsilon
LARHDKLVIYNASFDTNFLAVLYQKQGRPVPKIIDEAQCAMQRYADYASHGQRRARWYKLSSAAAHVGHEWQGKAHSALADCYATKAVWEYLDEQEGEYHD